MPRLAIFDLDDTLVDTSHVYWLARTRFLDCMETHRIDRSQALHEFESIDTAHILEYGYVPERYERSMLLTYHKLRVDPSEGAVLEEIRRAGRIVQDCVPALIPGAVELLHKVRAAGFRTALITRGIEEVQKKKLTANDLWKHFDDVEIVAKKDPTTFQIIIDKIGLSPEDTWIVGDSVKSDINPGLAIGVNCILYLYTHHSYYWQQEYGEAPAGRFYLARNLPEVLETLLDPEKKQTVDHVPSRNPDLPV